MLKEIESAVKKTEEEIKTEIQIGKRIKTVSKIIGPGVITGLSDDDPSGIGTYSIAGARFGLGLNWLAPFQLPLMIAIQEMCARLGLVTGRGLAGNIKQFLSRRWLYLSVFLLVIANTVNIGADISAMAASMKLVAGGNLVFWAIILTIIIIVLEIFVSYRVYANILKWLGIFFFAYVITAFLTPQNWSEVFLSLIRPKIQFSREFLLTAVGFLGTTISPYLFFWQTSEEVEEEVAAGKIKEIGQKIKFVHPKEIKKMRWDTVLGMVFSQAIAVFIVITCAATLFKNGVIDIDSAEKAASALQPLAGDMAGWLFAIGIIAAGFLGIPVLAGSAAYAMSEAFGWREGLFHKFKEARGFYSVIAAATAVGLLINFLGVNPIKALLYAAVLNGLVAVPLIAFIIILANKKEVMGAQVNRWYSNLFGWLTFAVMLLAAVLLLLVR